MYKTAKTILNILYILIIFVGCITGIIINSWVLFISCLTLLLINFISRYAMPKILNNKKRKKYI
jgi:ABC-type bacteriocin/lantibiotic exporter with double-glycine peptidase domain